MEIFGEDGPEFLGNLNKGQNEMVAEQQRNKEMYMRHFMMDFIEHGLRKAVQENAIHCAKNVGYFENLMQDQNVEQQMYKDQEFEKCLGKYSDSYEQALDVFGQHLKSLKQQTVVTHSQPLQSSEQREKRYHMGGGPNEPIYDTPEPQIHQGMVDLKLMENFVQGYGTKNSKSGSPADMQQMPFNYYKEQNDSSKSQ